MRIRPVHCAAALLAGAALASAASATLPKGARGRRPDWAEVDWSRHVADFQALGGRMRYCDYGEGIPLVLLHGMGCCWEWWLECLPQLGRGYRVIAVDLPGFGDSAPLREPAEIADYASSVAELLEALGIERTAVAGHSMGGLVALALADAQPLRVARLVLVGSGGVPMSERRLEAILSVLRFAHRTLTRPRVLELIATSPVARALLLRGAMRDPRVMSDELAALIAPRLAAPAFGDAIRASASAVRASRPEQVTTSTALIWGELDVFAPLHTARDMLARLPEGRLDVVPGVGHSPMVEAPAEFTRLLMERADFTLPLNHGTTTR